MAVVIIAAAQEEVRSSLMQESPNGEEDEVDGWVKQVEDFHQAGCCLSPA